MHKNIADQEIPLNYIFAKFQLFILRNESVRFVLVLRCFVFNKMNVFLYGIYNNFADLFGQIIFSKPNMLEMR